MSASWSVSQRAVLAEMGLPLYRLRGASSADPVAPEAPGRGAAHGAFDTADVSRTRWFAQLSAFLAGINVDLQSRADGVELRIGAEQPLTLSALLPVAEEKRAIYRAAKAALRGRH